MASLCMQGVVNDPNASDAIAKSVSTSKNRYLNMHTCEMSRAWLTACMYIHTWHLYLYNCNDSVVLVQHIVYGHNQLFV